LIKLFSYVASNNIRRTFTDRFGFAPSRAAFQQQSSAGFETQAWIRVCGLISNACAIVEASNNLPSTSGRIQRMQ